MNNNLIFMSIIHLKECVKKFGLSGGVCFNYRFFLYKIGITKKDKGMRHLRLKKYNGQPVYYRKNSSDIPLVHSILVWNGEYDVEVDESKFDVILDLGANIGLFSLLYSLRYPNKKLIAVEPEKNNYALAIKNLKNLQNANTLNSGIWWRQARLKINNHGMEWSFTVKETEEKDYDVEGIDIDTICKQYGIDNKMLFIKMDIEGTEKEIFEHISEAQWIDKTNYLIMEIHGSKESELYRNICGIMEEKGFEHTVRGENTFFTRI